MDYLTSLPDVLHHSIFNYLSYHEKMTIISCNTSLNRLYFKKERGVKLSDENLLNFFHNIDFQQIILSKIDSPLDQLLIFFSKPIVITELYDALSQGDKLLVPQLNGVKTLKIPIDIYVMLNELYPDFIPVVQNLHLREGTYPEEYDDSYEGIIPLRVKTSIHFESFRYPLPALSLPSMIEVLSFNYCSGSFSSPLPNLRVVKLIESVVLSDDFNNLQELSIDENALCSLRGRSQLNTAKRLIVEGVGEFTGSLTFLQDNEEIYITGSHQMLSLDYSKCFKKSKKINIKSIAFSNNYNIDLSYSSQVEEFTLTGKRVGLNNGLATGLIPTTLKRLYLMNVYGITNLIGFEHLRKISLLNCPDITTLTGLTRVPFIHLSGLVLTSLEGLGENKVVWIVYCNNITDFSPLKFVNRVTVVNCKGFRDASHLDHVSHVTITSCDGLEDVSGLQNAESVEISKCPLIKSVEALKHVKNLKVLS